MRTTYVVYEYIPNERVGTKNRVDLSQACFFTGFAAIQDNGISLIMSLEKNA